MESVGVFYGTPQMMLFQDAEQGFLEGNLALCHFVLIQSLNYGCMGNTTVVSLFNGPFIGRGIKL